MNSHERRRERILRAVEHYQEKLDRLDPTKYAREVARASDSQDAL